MSSMIYLSWYVPVVLAVLSLAGAGVSAWSTYNTEPRRNEREAAINREVRRDIEAVAAGLRGPLFKPLPEMRDEDRMFIERNLRLAGAYVPAASQPAARKRHPTVDEYEQLANYLHINWPDDPLLLTDAAGGVITSDLPEHSRIVRYWHWSATDDGVDGWTGAPPNPGARHLQ